MHVDERQERPRSKTDALSFSSMASSCYRHHYLPFLLYMLISPNALHRGAIYDPDCVASKSPSFDSALEGVSSVSVPTVFFLSWPFTQGKESSIFPEMKMIDGLVFQHPRLESVVFRIPHLRSLKPFTPLSACGHEHAKLTITLPAPTMTSMNAATR